MMKKTILMLLLSSLLCGFSFAKTAVIYFSCTGNTKKLAQNAAQILNADIMEIEPLNPYTKKDLEYYTDCRADREQRDNSARPQIKTNFDNLNQYSTIVLAYPIWHGQAPKIIYTFLESNDFSQKTIIPFCTSYSSPLGTSDSNLHKSAPKARWKNGKRFSSSASNQELKKFLDESIK